MKYILTAVFTILFSAGAISQNSISTGDLRMLRKQEDSLKRYSRQIIDGQSLKIRMDADSLFTRVFVRALLTKNSYAYAFDSVSFSKLESPDGDFKIYTWNLEISDNMNRQRGAIQMKTEDGSLKLFPLIDKSDVIESPIDTITDNRNWFGAVYYHIQKNTAGDKTYYTLLGFDPNDRSSNKKVIDVLSFEEGKPVFGATIFQTRRDNPFTGDLKPARYIIEYKKESVARLSYSDQEKMIMIEHLVSETNEPKKKWTFIPDGGFDGFTWKDNRWIFMENTLSFVPSEKAPMPIPLRDKEGKIDETKLKQKGVEE